MDIRTLILTRVKEAGKSLYWLARAQHVVHWKSAYEYLCGRRDTTGRVLGELMDILGLGIQIHRAPRVNSALQARTAKGGKK